MLETINKAILELESSLFTCQSETIRALYNEALQEHQEELLALKTTLYKIDGLLSDYYDFISSEEE